MFSLETGRRVRLSLTGVVVVAIAFSCAAQTSRVAGAIQGSVVDQTVSAVANATLTLRNQGTNRTRTVSTNAAGSFRVSELPVGPYEVRVESPSFAVRKQCDCGLNRKGRSGNRAACSCGRAATNTEATTIDHERIEESAVVSRNYLDFVLLAPQLTRSNVQGGTPARTPWRTADSSLRASVSAVIAFISTGLRTTMNLPDSTHGTVSRDGTGVSGGH